MAVFSELYGNEILKADLLAALSAGRLAHAYIVEGPPLCGKHTLCRAIAAALGGADFAEKIRSGACPDVQTFGLPKDKKTVSVDLVRAVKESVYLKPVELGCKVYLLENTELMTLQAQNALLKLLEEPPQNVYFFLLCDSASHLLPTVQSRAPILRMELFSYERLTALLSEKEKKAGELLQKDPVALERIVRQSEGCYGMALQLLDARKQRGQSSREEKLWERLLLLSKKDTVSVLTAISQISQKREETLEELSLLQSAVAELLLQKTAGRRSVLLYGDGRADALCAALPKNALLSLYEAIGQCHAAVSANGNVTLQLTHLTYAALHALQGQK